MSPCERPLFPLKLKNSTLMVIRPVMITEEAIKPFFLNNIDWPHKSFVKFAVDMTGALVQIVLELALSLTAQNGTNLDFNGLSNKP